MEIDTQKLRQIVQDFKYHARPSNATCGAPATVDDINRVIDSVSKALVAFIREIETAE